MRFIKVIFGSLLVIIGLIFIIENKVVLEQTLQLRLDLYIGSFQSPSIPIWVLVLFTFFLGVFTASLYGVYELLKQRQTIRQLRHNLEILSQEIKRAGAVAEASTITIEPTPHSRDE